MKRKIIGWMGAIAFVLVAVFLAIHGISDWTDAHEDLTVQETLTIETFNTSDGQTRVQICGILRNDGEQSLSGITLTLDNGLTVTDISIPYRSNYELREEQIWNEAPIQSEIESFTVVVNGETMEMENVTETTLFYRALWKFAFALLSGFIAWQFALQILYTQQYKKIRKEDKI